MSKVSSFQKNKNRKRLIEKYAGKRQALRDIIQSKETLPEERISAVFKLAQLPRNSSRTRYRERCEITGRSRGVYRKFRMGRVVLRDLASRGQIPGVVKSSW